MLSVHRVFECARQAVGNRQGLRTQKQDLNGPVQGLLVLFDRPVDAGIPLESLLVRLGGF